MNYLSLYYCEELIILISTFILFGFKSANFGIIKNRNLKLQAYALNSRYEPLFIPMVDRKGVEPLTSSVQTRRSSQLSYRPKVPRANI